MKPKNRSQSLIALTVIGCSLVLLAALTVALSGFQWSTGGRTLQIEFKDATGIKIHSPVRYAGAIAGKVVAIRYLNPAERARPGKQDNAVRVTVRLNDDVPPLPADVQASISSETVLGEKFVALSAGTSSALPLIDGAVIQGQSLAGLENLSQSLEKTTTTVMDLLQKLNADYPELKSNLNSLLTSGQAFLSSGTNLVQDGHLTLNEMRGTLQRMDTALSGLTPQASNLLAHAAVSTTNLNHTLENARAITTQIHTFLTNGFLANLDYNMKHLTNVLARLEITSEYAKILAAQLAERPSRLIWSRRATKLPSEEEIRNPPPPSAQPPAPQK